MQNSGGIKASDGLKHVRYEIRGRLAGYAASMAFARPGEGEPRRQKSVI